MGLELLDSLLEPQVDQRVGRDASLFGLASNSLRQSLFDRVERFLRLKLHIAPDRTGLVPMVGQIVLVPEFAYGGI